MVLACPLPPSRERARRLGKSIVYDAHKTIGDIAIPKMSKGWEDLVKSMLKAELTRKGAVLRRPGWEAGRYRGHGLGAEYQE